MKKRRKVEEKGRKIERKAEYERRYRHSGGGRKEIERRSREGDGKDKGEEKK